jgi:hypothetical protein
MHLPTAHKGLVVGFLYTPAVVSLLSKGAMKIGTCPQ